MGVRGLTGFIARKAELYLTPYELHDCNLVIDGDCLACNIYTDFSGVYSAFGGDYDDFYRAVVNFFKLLAECNIKAYVLMDGGYERRKLRTVGKRMRGKIAVIKRINPCGSQPIFPVMLKEVFIDAVKSCGVPLMRCLFEADQELATLSRKLNCAVLSYDSDFYIYNVNYIPLITLTARVYTKFVKHFDEEHQDKNANASHKLKQNKVRHLQKRINSNRVMEKIFQAPTEGYYRKKVAYKFLDCCIYRTENFKKVTKDKLPLFAALLGNDYISRACFTNIAISGMTKKGSSRKCNQQQRRINNIINWLKHETAETALEKILNRLPKNKQAQIEAAISTYSDDVCQSYDFFSTYYKHAFETLINQQGAVYPDEDGQEGGELNVDEVEESDEEDELIDADKTLSSPDSDKVNSSSSDADKNVNKTVADICGNKQLSIFPQWFVDKFSPGNLPRFMVDLLYLQKYINQPQIEHFQYNDCNEVALPILVHTFTLLHSVKPAENEQHDHKRKFTYLTRRAHVTNIHYEEYEAQDPPRYSFDPYQPNPLLLNAIFEQKMPELSVPQLLSAVNNLPEDLQLYFLAVVYWLQRSPHCDMTHLQALIVCMVVVRTVDSSIPPERDIKAFQKRFGKILRKERQVREQQLAGGIKRQIRSDLLDLPAPKRMHSIPKSDCYLVQNELLKYFHMPEIFKKKYDLYSTIVLHAFSEFQSILFQLHSLNALLDTPYASPHLNQLYCGVFLYNLYELLKKRPDPHYYVQNFIFRDSQMMFDFYQYMWDWCYAFVPPWKKAQIANMEEVFSGNVMKKRRQQNKKECTACGLKDLNDYTWSTTEDNDEEDNNFYDINNKFCTFLKISN